MRYDRIRATYERDPLPAMRKNAAAFAANREQTYNLKAGFARLKQQIGIGKYHIGLGVAERARLLGTQPRLRTQTRAQHTIRHGRNVAARRMADFRIAVCQQHQKLYFGVQRQRHEQREKHQRGALRRRIGKQMEIRAQLGNRRQLGIHPRQKPQRQPAAGANAAFGSQNLPELGQRQIQRRRIVVAKQNRFAKGQSNIIGTDLGASSGFGVLPLNAGWRFAKNATFQAGVDNVFNKTYAEFVSKG